jgi:predicted RND superfamily exporter protein
MIDKVFQWIVRNEKIIFISVFIIILISVYGLFLIRIDNDVLHWFSKDSEIAKLNYYVNERFKSNNPMVIMIDFKDDVFTHENLQHIRNISRLIQDEEGIINVLSLTEADDVRGKGDTLVIEKLFPEDIPSSEEEIKSIKKYVFSKESFVGSLVSYDSKSANIIALPDPEVKADEIGAKVRKKIEEYIKSNNLDCKLYFGGTPMLLNSMSKIVVNDISKLVPVVSIIVLLTLFLSFRGIVETLVPLTTVLIATLIGMGIMGYLEYPLTTFSVAIPVVLIAVGNAYAIHVINEFREKQSIMTTSSKEEILMAVIRRIFMPVLMSGLTTIASFISIGIGNDMNSIKNFSTVTSLGTFFALLLTYTFVIAILKTTSNTYNSSAKQKEYHESKFLRKLGQLVMNHKVVVASVVIILVGLSIYSMTKIKVEVDYLGYFDKNAEPRIVSEAIANKFDGSFEMKVYFKGDVQNPNLLKVMSIIEEETRFFLGGKTKPTSIVGVISELNEGMVNVKMIPNTEYEVQNLWFFIEGNQSVERIVTPEKDEALISVLLGKVSSEKRYELINYISNQLELYKKATNIPPYENIDYTSLLITKFVFNRLSRAGVVSSENVIETTNLIFPLIRTYLENNLSTLKKLNNYQSKEKFLKNFVEYIYSSLNTKGIKVNEDIISRSDMMYALSPSVWNYLVLPSPNGDAIFEKGEVTGIAKLFSDMEKRLLANQAMSLSIIIFVVLILNTLTFGSFIEGLISLIPILLTVIIDFGILGIFDIKLDYIMITVASIAIGTGIDYTIHFISRYTYEIKNGLDFNEAFYKTVSTTGKGIFFNAFSVGLGFATLLLSTIVPLRNFGLLLFVSMIVSSVSALFVLPVFMYLAKNTIIKLSRR